MTIAPNVSLSQNTADCRDNIGGRYNIQKLLPRHFKIIELAVAGHDHSVIAKILDVTPGLVQRVLLSPLAQGEMVRMRESLGEVQLMTLDRDAAMGKARSILEQASLKASVVIEEKLNSSNETIQLKAAESILDRVFGKKGDNSGGAGIVVNITADQVQLLNQALLESRNVTVQSADGPPAQCASGEQSNVQRQDPERPLDAGPRSGTEVNGIEGSAGNEHHGDEGK